MLKQIRNGALSNPWIFKLLMLGIALAFVVTMGWGSGAGNPGGNYVAQVGEVKVSLVHYKNIYRNARRTYQNILKENFKEEMVQQVVINSLIERELWLNLAGGLNLVVGVEELRSRLIMDPIFFNENATFDPKRYQNFLQQSGLTASGYEGTLREELRMTKAKQVVQDGISLTDEEIIRAKALVAGVKLSPERRVEEETLQVQNALAQKQQKVLSSVLARIRAQTPIEIQAHLL